MLKKIISYIYPVTKRIPSHYSGKLELTTINGKKVLDTLNTNYSYGSLQRVLKYSIDQINVEQCNNILILGLGGGSVIQTLREDKKVDGHITAVEIDQIIIDIAENEFDIKSNQNTRIICDDAWNFMLTDKHTYDLIIVDLFIDNEVPSQFLKLEFWKNILNHLDNGSDVIFNSLCNPKTDLTNLKDKLHRRNIQFEIHRYVEKTNKVLIAHYDHVA
jgi:spermidine synthase